MKCARWQKRLAGRSTWSWPIPGVRRITCSRGTARSTRRCCRLAACRMAARSSRPTSGGRRSRGTTAGGSRTRCGAFCRRRCCRRRRIRLAPLALGFERNRSFDNLQESALRSLRGLVAGPERGGLGLDDVSEVAAALDAERRECRDVHRAGPLVAMLDKQPAAAVATCGTDERPGALELHTVEAQLHVPLLHRGVDVLDERLPGAGIPQHHDPHAVAFRN